MRKLLLSFIVLTVVFPVSAMAVMGLNTENNPALLSLQEKSDLNPEWLADFNQWKLIGITRVPATHDHNGLDTLIYKLPNGDEAILYFGYRFLATTITGVFEHQTIFGALTIRGPGWATKHHAVWNVGWSKAEADVWTEVESYDIRTYSSLRHGSKNELISIEVVYQIGWKRKDQPILDETEILAKAKKQGKAYEDKQNKEIKYLKEELSLRNIYYVPYHDTRVTDEEVVSFLKELLADIESQKIFRKFSKSSVTVWLSDYYGINKVGSVEVKIKDGVKKVAEWLSK